MIKNNWRYRGGCFMLARFALIAVACSAGSAQSFEVASVKPATPLGPMGMRAEQKGGPGTSDPGIFICQNCSLYWVLADAYKIHSYDFSGPDWLQSARFDFSARIPAGTAKEDFQKMIANLLTERFKMATHRETRQIEVYEMSVAKNGPKFKESTPKDAPKDSDSGGPLRRDADGFPVLRPGNSLAIAPGHARLRSEDKTMAWFAEMLSDQLQRPVHDVTGLTARYDFVLSWSWEENAPGAREAAVADIITQLPAQLGLKLERKKGPVEVLVLDHMEKAPTAN
jgi:uncharacterized protein (TIGR03435 family)